MLWEPSGYYIDKHREVKIQDREARCGQAHRQVEKSVKWSKKLTECANFAASLFISFFVPTWEKLVPTSSPTSTQLGQVCFWRANLANLANFVYQSCVSSQWRATHELCCVYPLEIKLLTSAQSNRCAILYWNIGRCACQILILISGFPPISYRRISTHKTWNVLPPSRLADWTWTYSHSGKHKLCTCRV